MQIQFDIQNDDLAIIKTILRKNVPKAKIWIFGSRAKGKGKAKPFSDLDLAIDLGREMTLEEYSALSSEFEDSLLPYKVDVVDLCNIDDSFREIISKEKKLFCV